MYLHGTFTSISKRNVLHTGRWPAIKEKNDTLLVRPEGTLASGSSRSERWVPQTAYTNRDALLSGNMTCGAAPGHSLPYLFIYPQSGEGREKERERNISVCLPLACPLLET